MPSSVFPIILNSKNSVNGDTSTYTYKFPRGSLNLKNASIALAQLNIYYSWPNINASAFNNNSFQIIFPDAGGSTTYDVVIPDGNYTVEQLNAFLQSFFIENRKYLINAETAQYRYFYEIKSNPVTYKIDLISYTIPIESEATGFLEPPGGFSYPTTTGQSPSMVILNNNFGNLIGFTPGTYQDASSDKVPQMSPVSSILIRCSLITNKLTNPGDIISSFIVGGQPYGSNLSISPPNLVFNRINDGIYTECKIQFIDDQFNRLNIIDQNLIIYLVLQIDE